MRSKLKPRLPAACPICRCPSARCSSTKSGGWCSKAPHCHSVMMLNSEEGPLLAEALLNFLSHDPQAAWFMGEVDGGPPTALASWSAAAASRASS